MITATNPTGQTVFFDPTPHRYFVGDVVLTSVTTFVESFFPEFKSEEIAAEYANKRGLKKEDVLAEWEKERKNGEEMGNAVHAYAEMEIKRISVSWFDYFGLASDHPKKYESHYRSVDQAIGHLRQRFEFIDAEKIVFSLRLGLAGTIDLVTRDKSNGDIVLFDWKSNKSLKKELFWGTASDPISHLMDCNWNAYRLQLNTYKLILEEENYFPETNKRMGLIHIKEDGPQWHKVDDMNDDVRAMINWV